MVMQTRSAARKQAVVDGGSESSQTKDAFNDAASANAARGVDGNDVPDKSKDTKAVKASKPTIYRGDESKLRVRTKATAPAPRTSRKRTAPATSRRTGKATSKEGGPNAENDSLTNDPQVDPAPKETRQRKRRLASGVDGEDGRNVRRRIEKNPSSVVPFRDDTNSTRRAPKDKVYSSFDGLVEVASGLLDVLAKEREKRDLAATSLLELPVPRIADQSSAAVQDLLDLPIPVAARMRVSNARAERKSKRPRSEGH